MAGVSAGRRKMMMMTIHALVLAMMVLVTTCDDSRKEKDKLPHRLPGQPRGLHLAFDQYAGYIDLGERSVYYYHVQHDRSSSSTVAAATTAPLMLWFTGVRVCSAVGYGGLLDAGPLRVQEDGTLNLNEWSLNKVANLLFVDLPAGVGFSTDKNSSSDNVVTEEGIVEDTITFLVKWLDRFPEYQGRELYLAGHNSGANHAVRLAVKLLPGAVDPVADLISFRLKGVILGNPTIDMDSTLEGFIDYTSARGMISDELKEHVGKACRAGKSSPGCMEAMVRALESVGPISVSAVDEPTCNLSGGSPKGGFGFSDACSENYLRRYMNKQKVQAAFHANSSADVPGPWDLCSPTLVAPPHSRVPPTLIGPLRTLIASKDVKLHVYSGDESALESVGATRRALLKVMNGSGPHTFGPWTDSIGQVGGYRSVYGGPVTHSTVRGAGTYAGRYQPVRALDLFTEFVQG